MLLRVAPPIPSALDRAINELQPGFVCTADWRRRQREELPEASVPNHCDDRLPARPTGMAIGPRMLGVGGHQPLLNSEDEVVRGVKSGGRHR
jgi:hypothetical protein